MDRLGSGNELKPFRPTPRQAVFLALFGLLLAVIVLEIGVRLLKRDIAFQPDPQTIRSLRPNVTRKLYSHDTEESLRELPSELPASPSYVGMDYTNNVGLRMKRDVGGKLEGEKRVLLLGDSFAEADSVPDEARFYSRAEESLRKRYGSTITILNGGIQNGAPSQYLLQLPRFLEELKPDVVIAVIAPNDVTDDFLFEQRFGYAFDERGIPTRPIARGRLWALKRIWSLRYLDVLANRIFPGLNRAMWPPHLPDSEIPSWEGFLCAENETSREWFLAKTGAYLVELKRMSEAGGAEFGTFFVNYMYLFDDEPIYKAEERQGAVMESLRAWNCKETKGAPYREFMYAFLSERGIPYDDPYIRLLREKRDDPRRKLWNYYDYHFSPAGHTIIAEELTDFIERSFPRLFR